VLGRGQDGGGTYEVVVHEEGQHESDQDAQPAFSVQVLDHLLSGVGDGVCENPAPSFDAPSA
jgi:hypothetical protein